MTTAIDLTVPDRRKSPRRAVSQVVKLELESGDPSDYPALLVTDLSAGGARLFAQTVEVPKTFSIVFTESGRRRECRKVWQIGPEVGIEFADKGRVARRAPRSRRRSLR